jgi:nicotinate-nucleotide adenylyltransferase
MKRKTFLQVCSKIQKIFEGSFGQTPLRQRNEDILREAIELSRFTSIANLKEEHGDLLCSLLMSCQENGWSPEDLIEATLAKIKRREKQYQAYGRKLNVAIIGGAFDPISPGHIAIAELILNSSSVFDTVWMMPCFKHMYGKKMVSPEHRLEMCRLATKHDRRIVVSDYEIKNKLGGETYHLAKRLFNEDFATHQFDFSFVIGLDNALTFDKWQNFEDLERMARFVVVPRQGYTEKNSRAWYMKTPHMFLCPEKSLPDISSTIIREDLKKGRDFPEENLNPDVFNYIRKNKLYV